MLNTLIVHVYCFELIKLLIVQLCMFIECAPLFLLVLVNTCTLKRLQQCCALFWHITRSLG